MVLSAQTVDTWGWLGPQGTGRQDVGPSEQGGALQEGEASCIWCWSIQLFPADIERGQCHGDSSPALSVNNSRWSRVSQEWCLYQSPACSPLGEASSTSV